MNDLRIFLEAKYNSLQGFSYKNYLIGVAEYVRFLLKTNFGNYFKSEIELEWKPLDEEYKALKLRQLKCSFLHVLIKEL